jgi:hypothetical protein
VNTTSKVYLRVLQSTGLGSNNLMSYDRFAIYQRPAYNSKWSMYLFNRVVRPENPGVNGQEDNYRIFKLQNVDISKPNPSYFPYAYNLNVEDLTIPGNWEKAVQIRSQTAPLIGGMHGYEKHVSIEYYADSMPFTPTLDHVIECNKLKIVVVSDLYDPKDNNTVIATTECDYLWDGEELFLNTTYNWKVTATVYTAYAAMFPVKRDALVSSVGQINGLSMENLTLNRKVILRGNAAKGITWNYSNNIKLLLEVLNPETALQNYIYNGDSNNGKTFFNNIGLYNKLYITRVHSPYSEIVTNTTVWLIQSRYRIWNDYSIPLTVTSKNPINGAVNVETNRIIKITFRSPIKAGNKYNNIILYQNGKRIPITKSISGYTLTINHPLLDTGIKYTLSLPLNSIVDLMGNAFAKVINTTFTTDKTTPRIIAVYPGLNAVNVPVNGVIKVFFSESIRFGTNYITLKDSSGKYIPTKRSINGNILTLSPTVCLAKKTNYILVLHTHSITDLSGIGIANKMTSFTTDSPPRVIAVYPNRNAVNVPVKGVIKVFFSESIRLGTNYITLKNSKGVSIPLVETISRNLLTIKHSNQLAYGAIYTLILHTGCVKDKTGNGLTNMYNIKFTTVKSSI